MTRDELNAIRYLTIGLAKETFKQDWESFGEEDDDYIREKLELDNYCKGVEDVLKILEDMKQEPRWISIAERSPECSGRYLVSYGSDYVSMARYYESVSKWGSTTVERIVAWMPLPQSYKENKNE